MPDSASTEGLREAAQFAYEQIRHHWSDADDFETIIEQDYGEGPRAIGHTYLGKAASRLRAALRDTGPRPDSGIDALVREWDDSEQVVRETPAPTREQWNRCLAARDALHQYAAALSTPRTETSEPTRAQVEQAFIDGSVEGSPIDHDGTPLSETSFAQHNHSAGSLTCPVCGDD